MIVKHGIAVSSGVAIGPALVYGAESFRIPRRFVRIDAVDAEIVRFRCALENVCREIASNEELASKLLGQQYGAIFSAHLQLARDPKLMHIAHHPKVAFEADGGTDGSYWSVVVRGTAERVTSEDEIRDSGVQALRSWSPSFKHFVMKVVAQTIAGRRFALGAGRADPLSPFHGDATAATAGERARARAGKPEDIPHRSPLPHEGDRR